jgi:hypothetical protein
MYQSDLYSHFMAKKLGMDGDTKKENGKEEGGDEKKVSIDEEAAQIAVDQIINNNQMNLENFKK